ncbi:helix-turn-helix domain-containing protein [Hahella chejuensis]|uniref:helix-turn-helix domain-containing protein n=1 Tax=Hahella chejuensis TaxID=158327 RepID=UPI0005A0B380
MLRYYRRSNGFTQKEFASLLGFRSRSQLSRVERGKRIPRLDQLLRFRILFGVPMQKLIPTTWTRTLNGLWEDIELMRTTCTKNSDCKQTEKHAFLMHAKEQVETLETTDA